MRRALCAGTLFPALLLGAGPFSFRLTPERLEVHEDGRPVLAYNYGMVLKEGVPESRRRSGYVHPLWAPDGTV
ncbi:MAG: PmoA family protein, partial [Bryobacteraceae bacterium]|nr:PmoA family protein [Bryobacteraceae bacterium]